MPSFNLRQPHSLLQTHCLHSVPSCLGSPTWPSPPQVLHLLPNFTLQTFSSSHLPTGIDISFLSAAQLTQLKTSFITIPSAMEDEQLQQWIYFQMLINFLLISHNLTQDNMFLSSIGMVKISNDVIDVLKGEVKTATLYQLACSCAAEACPMVQIGYCIGSTYYPKGVLQHKELAKVPNAPSWLCHDPESEPAGMQKYLAVSTSSHSLKHDKLTPYLSFHTLLLRVKQHIVVSTFFKGHSRYMQVCPYLVDILNWCAPSKKRKEQSCFLLFVSIILHMHCPHQVFMLFTFFVAFLHTLLLYTGSVSPLIFLDCFHIFWVAFRCSWLLSLPCPLFA